MANFGYHLARFEGTAVRSSFAALLPLLPPVSPSSRQLPFHVYSYSGEASLPEQVASIRSLLRHAGRPEQFTVVSDGTHSGRSIALLRAIGSFITVLPATDFPRQNLPVRLQHYLSTHPTGKQLGLIMALPRNAPALYVDSDVLFFSGARHLASLAADPGSAVLYLADCKLSADERLFRAPTEALDPVNTGLLFLPRELDWSLSIERFMELDGEPTFFTNQTMTHLTMHANGAQPFNREKFVLQLDDQFIYPDRYAGGDVALRHYVNPVRHKFWNALWR